MLRIILGMLLIIIGNAALGEPVIQSNTVGKYTRTQNVLGDITAALFEFQKLAAKEAREENKSANSNTSHAGSRAKLVAGYEYIIGLSQKINNDDFKGELQQLRKSLEELKRQTQQNLPLSQVNIKIQKISDEVRRLREREEALQNQAKHNGTRPVALGKVKLPPTTTAAPGLEAQCRAHPDWASGDAATQKKR
jgi:hypothetical protein